MRFVKKNRNQTRRGGKTQVEMDFIVTAKNRSRRGHDLQPGNLREKKQRGARASHSRKTGRSDCAATSPVFRKACMYRARSNWCSGDNILSNGGTEEVV